MNTAQAETKVQEALDELYLAVWNDLNGAQKELPPADYLAELARIAYTNQSNTSSSGPSARNMIEKVWRDEAIKRLSRSNFKLST